MSNPFETLLSSKLFFSDPTGPTMASTPVTKKDLRKMKLKQKKSTFRIKPVLPQKQIAKKPSKRELRKQRSHKKELKILELRDVIDPTRFYKKGISRTLENFQVGTIISGPADYHQQLPRKARAQTLAEELLKDQEIKKSITKRFSKLNEQNQSNSTKNKNKNKNTNKKKKSS
eukprot:TRINITY_DN5010_c0_g1_i1.p1 TRINITY_DN5010_c0_g1~~TRINITY_DN5010_c0_g1_i1.p1  ORF type:complete len:181 (-),score=38.27 TRINITY_DN5010_c0_g1_i1:110-628(-)